MNSQVSICIIEFSILSQFDDLKKSASSTTRPKLWSLGGRWRLKLQTSNWAQNVQEDLPHLENVDSGNSKQLFLNGPTPCPNNFACRLICLIFSYLCKVFENLIKSRIQHCLKVQFWRENPKNETFLVILKLFSISY